MAATLQRPDGILITGSPFAQYERVVVTFPNANTDQVIEYKQLHPDKAEDIHYLVMKQNAAGVVYNDQSATRTPWQQGYVILRSNTANLTVTLLLVVPRIVI